MPSKETIPLGSSWAECYAIRKVQYAIATHREYQSMVRAHTLHAESLAMSREYVKVTCNNLRMVRGYDVR